MKRIMIIGGHGAGKTTLALRLGEAIDLPVVHIDKSYYSPNWQRRPLREALADLENLAAAETWIMDGDDFRSIAPRLKRADMIVYLHVSTLKRVARYIKRAVKGFGKPRVDLPDGCKGTFDLNGLKWAAFGYSFKMRPEIHKAIADMTKAIPIIHVRCEEDYLTLETQLTAKTLVRNYFSTNAIGGSDTQSAPPIGSELSGISKSE